jgi:hypothetical protein
MTDNSLVDRTIEGAWKRPGKVLGSAQRCLEVAGICELRRVKPIVSNGFNRNWVELSRQKSA